MSAMVSESVRSANSEQLRALPFDDTQDFDDAHRGLIGRLEPCIVRAADGRVVWDNDSYRFLEGPAPDSVNPSLWRQSMLVAIDGLFEVVPGVYQVHGLDLSNITFIEGDTGVFVIDPLVSTETAAAALALYRTHRGDRPVVGVLYTHSHADHFGGVKGVTTQEDVDAGRCVILAPEHFLEHAVAENVYAGTAMARRAGYMYGAALDRGPEGQVGAGLGQTMSTGTVTLIVPTDSITATGHTRVVDGINMEFQLTPGTEAPAELNVLFPDHRALCMAENATHKPAQHPHAPGRARARPTHLGALPDRGHRPLRRPDRCRVRVAPLAHLGPLPGGRVPGAPAGPVHVPPRPDAAAPQPGHGGRRDRRGDADAAGAGTGVAHPRLFRLGQPQREGHLPALHGLV